MSAAILSMTVAGGSHALTVIPTYIDNPGLGETWTASRIAVVEQAIEDWQALIQTPAGSPALEVDIVFTDVTEGYLGQMAVNYDDIFVGDDLKPWNDGVAREMRFNSYYFEPRGGSFPDTIVSWFDPDVDDATGPSGSQWDLLSVARHEFGHMLGFIDDFFVEDVDTPSESDYWTDQIAGNTFDPGGLNVPMVLGDLAHVANSATNPLMRTALTNGDRQEIDLIDAQMLVLAYGYELIPEPATASFALLAGAALLTRRRRQA